MTIATDVTNLGRGPAIVLGTAVFALGAENRSTAAWNYQIPIGPKETTSLVVSAHVEPTEGDEPALVLYYRSASGREYLTRHRIKIRCGFHVNRVDIQREELPAGRVSGSGV